VSAPEKPSLHEIAAMPFPESLKAMRKHYVKDWGTPIPEGATAKQKFEVRVDYEARISGSETIEVEAWSEDEALKMAEEKVCKEIEDDCFAFDDVEFDEVSSKIVVPRKPKIGGAA
jgi:hypothetical protein